MKIAIFGCGQNAMMMAKAARKLGIEVAFIATPDEETTSVYGLGKIVRYTPGMSATALYETLGRPSIVTIEREQVDIELLYSLEAFCQVHPSPEAIAVTRNRILEKKILQSFNFPTAPYIQVRNLHDLKQIGKTIYPPFFIKHPTLGYDGKSQWQITSHNELENFYVDPDLFPLILEHKVFFLYEASLIGVRDVRGEIRYYTETINEHDNGILIRSYTVDNKRIKQRLLPARQVLAQLLHHWNYVGVINLELFVTPTGLVINELGSRVHNSGHWTMDGCKCSQFENHIRAIAGLPLGETYALSNAGMVNILGIDELPFKAEIDKKIYWYNKYPKPRRKMGHINIVDSDPFQLKQKQNQLIAQLYTNNNPLQKSV